jgi:hypothetical protein
MEATSTHLNSTTWGVVFYHNLYANNFKEEPKHMVVHQE